jgi:hypothetical protein
MSSNKTHVVQMNINTSHFNKNSGRYRINLGQNVDFNNCTISLVSAYVYNSTYNIKASYNNNRIGVKWIDNNIYQFTIEDGTYSISNLNDYLESKMFESGLYVKITATGKPNYFIKLQENPVLYGCHVICSYVPSSSEATTLGYEKPDGVSWNWPTTSVTPQLLLITDEMGTLLGFTDSVLPSTPVQSDNYEIVSPVAPKLSPVFNYLVNCNLLNNALGLVGSNQLFFQMPVNKSIGEMLEFLPNFKLDLPCVGKHDHIEIWLTDETYLNLEYRDKDISVCLILEFKN